MVRHVPNRRLGPVQRQTRLKQASIVKLEFQISRETGALFFRMSSRNRVSLAENNSVPTRVAFYESNVFQSEEIPGIVTAEQSPSFTAGAAGHETRRVFVTR
jgi:hypothetical protein